ncbi:hypothetical protein [Limnothrix sp. PR1529]|uniref:hypothetical protein n=1 Tax=Limnothrix sp. PR1529 TaxID=1704291 RepID=UPI00081E647B|nr:hypothetical protein [Limnothrix sp. PR1529]OCQ93821.1 hypothetical protein BCR12_10740 [Limnothrix sp. P13C2]
MTTNIILNQPFTDSERRKKIHLGDIFVLSQLNSITDLCEYAFALACEQFNTDQPQNAFNTLPVEEFARHVERLKNVFTNSRRSKELIRSFLEETGCVPSSYYFDVPRIRVVPNYDYLHSGVSYSYAPHRDTWYSSPTYQINHWVPILPITPDTAMSIWPDYFSRPVENSSSLHDIEYWDKVERKRAVQNIGSESRRHPLPLEDINSSSEIRIAGKPGDIIIFSASHLHGTVPNLTQTARMSIDFRTIAKGDIGVDTPPNVDSRAGGMGGHYYLSQLFDASTLDPYNPTNNR